MQPLVSVLISYYNDEAFLRQSIESVLSQTYTNFELLLLNHATTDSSREIAHSYRDTRIKHIDMDKNMGASGGYIYENFLKYAKGEYIKGFSADDILLPNAIELLVTHMQANPQLGLLGGAMKFIDHEGNSLEGPPQEHITKNYSTEECIKFLANGSTPFACPTVMVTREAYFNAYVSPALIYLADVQFWSSIVFQGYECANLSEPICLYRCHPEQMSSLGTIYFRRNLILFEHSLFNEMLYVIKDPKIVKIICEKSPFFHLIDTIDPELYPFVLHHYYLYFSSYQNDKIVSFIKISDMLKSEELRHKIDEAFSYTLKDLRDLYRSEEFLMSVLSKVFAPPTLWQRFIAGYQKFIKALNPFRYWPGHKIWKKKIRAYFKQVKS